VQAYDWQADPAGLGRLDLQGTKILGKYESVKALADGYQELRRVSSEKDEQVEQRLAAKYQPPEQYDFSKHQLSDDVSQALSKSFKELGLTQEAAEKAIPLLQELVTPMAVEQNIERLGQVWGGDKPLGKPEVLAKLGEIDAWARQHFGEEGLRQMEAAGAYDTPESILLLDNLRKMQSEGKLWAGGKPASGADSLKSRIAAIEADPAYFDWKTQRKGARYDELHKERTALYEQLGQVA